MVRRLGFQDEKDWQVALEGPRLTARGIVERAFPSLKGLSVREALPSLAAFGPDEIVSHATTHHSECSPLRALAHEAKHFACVRE